MKFQDKEIKDVYKEFIKGNKIKPKDKAGDFKKFLKFLEIDFYDWVRENLKCYFKSKSGSDMGI